MYAVKCKSISLPEQEEYISLNMYIVVELVQKMHKIQSNVAMILVLCDLYVLSLNFNINF